MSGEGMCDVKDPVIKLFGKMIPLPETDTPANIHLKSDVGFQILEQPHDMDMCGKVPKLEAADIPMDDCGNQQKSSAAEDNNEDQALDIKQGEQAYAKQREENVGSCSNSEEKVLKKPDKILPCPRCNSLETKFCYFNNYNVNQPRHFCRNCQRYWTAGGTMRKVPVGAGRRRNKQLATQYSQISVPHVALPSIRAENSDSTSQHILSHDESPIALKTLAENEKLPKFGPRLGESMISVGPTNPNGCEEVVTIFDNKEEPSQCASSMTTSSLHEDETLEKVTRDEQGSLATSCKILMPQQSMTCYPIPRWTSWDPFWNSSHLTAMSSVVTAKFSTEPTHPSDETMCKQINWCSPPVMAVPGFCSASIPMQLLPAPYWGLSCWPASIGNNTPLARSSNNSQTKGKNSRDEPSMKAETSKKRVIVPKILRVNDPNEASKSTVWETLGIKPCVSKTVQTAAKMSDNQLNGSPVLEANPVALFRSQSFHEST